MRKFLFVPMMSLLVGCATLSPSPQPTTEPIKPAQPGKEKIKLVEDGENINTDGVRRALGLSPNREDLGYIEKTFDTCEVGNGFSKVKNCRKKYLILIQLRMQCRDSEGTTSEIVTAAKLTALTNQDIVWSVKTENGEARTDSQGYAQMQFIASVSQKGQRVRIGNKSDFLYLKADEIKQIILPRYWCNE